MLRPAAALLLALLPIPLLGPGVEAGRRDPYLEGDRLEFAFDDLDGKAVRSSDRGFEGKVLLVDLWGTWCAPCISEIPTLVDLQERLGAEGLVIVAIAFEEEEEEPETRRAYLREFVAEHGINYLVLDGQAPRDSDEALPGLKNVRGFPVEILIGRDGRVVDIRNGYGYKKRWARKLQRELTELLQGPPP
jgi:thiol-disulfide isomerase/thioredoxin